MAKLDIPLDALKLVVQHGPPDTNPSLTWTDENGFVLSMNVGGQMMPVRFDYGETLEDIKQEIQMVTGITLPSEEKDNKGSAPYEPPGEKKEASMKTPLLDKTAALGSELTILGRSSERSGSTPAGYGWPTARIKGQRDANSLSTENLERVIRRLQNGSKERARGIAAIPSNAMFGMMAGTKRGTEKYLEALETELAARNSNLALYPPQYALAPDGTGPHGRGAGPGKGKADGSGMDKDEGKSASMKTPLLDKIAVLGDGLRGDGPQYTDVYNEMTGNSGSRAVTPTRTTRPISTAIGNIGAALRKAKTESS